VNALNRKSNNLGLPKKQRVGAKTHQKFNLSVESWNRISIFFGRLFAILDHIMQFSDAQNFAQSCAI